MLSAMQAISNSLPGTMFKDAFSVQKGLVECYEKGLHSDVTLLAPNGNRMLAHQAILAVSSTRFASILADGKFTQKELPVQGVDSVALETIIRFFYTGECQLQAGSAIALLDAAIKLEAKGLAAHVEGYINQLLSVIPATCLIFLDQAVGLQMETVAGVMLANVVNKIDELVSYPTFCALEYPSFSRVAKECAAKGLPREILVRVATRWILSEGLPSSVQSQRLGLAEEISALVGFNILENNNTSGPTMAVNASSMGLNLNTSKPEATMNPGVSTNPGASMNMGAPLPAPTFPNASDYGISSLGGGGGPSFQGQAQATLPFGSSSISFQVPVIGGGSNPSLTSLQNASNALLQQQQQLMPMSLGGSGLPEGLSSYNFPQPVPQANPRASRPPSGQQRPPAKKKAYRPFLSRMDTDEGLGTFGFSEPDGPSPPDNNNANDPRAQKMPKLVEGIDRNLCHIVGCGADLTQLREYHQRFRLCDQHLKASAVLKDGIAQRFCQQCGRFHPLNEFDGAKRSCRARLLRHNARRRRKVVGPNSYANKNHLKHPMAMHGQGSAAQLASFPYGHQPLPWSLDGHQGVEGLKQDMEEVGEDEGEDEDGYGAYPQGEEEEEMRAGYTEEENLAGGGGGEQVPVQQGDLGSWPGTITLASPNPPEAPAGMQQQQQDDAPPPQVHAPPPQVYAPPQAAPAEGMVMINGVGCEMQDSKIQDVIEAGVSVALKLGSATNYAPPTDPTPSTAGFRLLPLASSLLAFTAPTQSDKAPTNTLSVGNLSSKVKEEEVASLFGAQSGFRHIQVIKEPPNRVTCLVEFEDVASASAARASLQGAVLESSDLGGIHLDFHHVSLA